MTHRKAAPIAIAFGLVACQTEAGGPPPPPTTQAVEVEGVRDGRTTVAVGQRLRIALSSNATTGYRWRIEGDYADVLTPGAPFGDEVADAHAPGMVGVGGSTVWLFRATRAGETTLTFVYARSWERDTPPAGTATYSVVVR